MPKGYFVGNQMRKLLILTTFISSLMMSSMVHAKWTKVTGDKRSNTAYVDFDRIKKYGDKVYFWQLVDLLKPTRTRMISFKTYHEAECGRFRLRWLNAWFFEGPMGSGKISSQENTPQKHWRYPPPDSMDEGILNAVCNHKP